MPPGPYLSLLNSHWLPSVPVSTVYGGRLSLGGDNRFEGQPAISNEAGEAHRRALYLSNPVHTGAKGTLGDGHREKCVCLSQERLRQQETGKSQRLFAGQVVNHEYQMQPGEPHHDMSNRINISKDEVDLRDPVRRTSGVWEFKTTLSN